jgi:hypothetical protein
MNFLGQNGRNWGAVMGGIKGGETDPEATNIVKKIL